MLNMITVFFSYSHIDEKYRIELEKHLSTLRRKGVIDTWHDRKISPGENLDTEIDNNLKKANLILLLVSPDFLNSDYCYEREMQCAMERHEKGEAIVIPIILRPCDWQDSLFGKLLALPRDGKPVTSFVDLDEAFLDVTRGIKRAIEKISNPSLLKNTAPQKQISDSPVQAFQPVHRSSNLTIGKTFSDHEKDKFLRESFLFTASFFKESLEGVKQNNSHIDYLIEQIDGKTFTAIIYDNGSKRSECMIFLGSTLMGQGISYSSHISSTRNSLNEGLNVVQDSNYLYLKPLNLSSWGQGSPGYLDKESAAEFLWAIFIRPLQQKR